MTINTNIAYNILIISLIFAIIILLIYDICNNGKIGIYHLLITILIVLIICIHGVISNKVVSNIPKPNTHPASAGADKFGDINNLKNGSPVLDKTNMGAAPLEPNAYDVCVGLLDTKTPAELAKMADELRSTSSDAILNRDGSSLNPHWKNNPTEERRLIAMEIYPFMSGNQINTHDCLNDQGNGNSCFQSPSLMQPSIINGAHPIGDNLAANSKRGHFSNQATAILNLREGFQSNAYNDNYNGIVPGYIPAKLTGNYEMPGDTSNLQFNAPKSNTMCTHCKIGKCMNGYCGDSNYYFF